MYNNCVVVIPSLEPDDKLLRYVNDLQNNGIENIVVVNDGSDSSYKNIFDSLEKFNVKVLNHDINLGKGQALKTAFKFLKEKNNFDYIITADSDGQHTVEDIISIINFLSKNSEGLVLGTRNFNLDNVPPKSRFGNKITSYVYKLFYKQYIPDTQTGLRGFSKIFLNDMLIVEGNRFEYEMNMLIYFSTHKIPIFFQNIETIYNNNNDGTHFHPIKDSIKIYKVIIPKYIKFIFSSFSSWFIDYISFVILFFVFLFLIRDNYIIINLSGYISRLISSIYNYLVNKKFVFISDANKKSIIYYFLLVIFIITLSNALVYFSKSVLNIYPPIIKPIIDISLSLLSYFIQKYFIFK